MNFRVLPQAVTVQRQNRPYVILAITQVLDVLMTWAILSYWSVQAEGNALVASLLHNTGITVGLGLLLTFKLWAVWMFWYFQTGVKIMNAIYGLVITNNLIFFALWAYYSY